jgi:hypothetical protein
MEPEARHELAELQEHFGVDNAAVKDDELEPVVPGRKRRVMAACACILGELMT